MASQVERVRAAIGAVAISDARALESIDGDRGTPNAHADVNL